jgi:hypothetical protein
MDIEPRVRDAIAQVEMMLDKGPVTPALSSQQRKGGRALVIEQVTDILEEVLSHLAPDTNSQPYLLYGTGAGLVQGIFQPVEGVRLLGQKHEQLHDFNVAMRQYPQLEDAVLVESNCAYRTTYLVRGIEVSLEIPAAPEEAQGEFSTWESAALAYIGTFAIRMEALEVSLARELALNRPAHFVPTLKHFQKHSADLELLGRAMQAFGLSTGAINKVEGCLQTRASPSTLHL